MYGRSRGWEEVVVTTWAELSNEPRALVWVSDESDASCEFNPSWLSWQGRPLQVECQRGWRSSIAATDRTWVTAVHLQHLGSHTPYAVECHLTRDAVDERTTLVGVAPWYHRDGVFAGFVGSCLDITEIPRERRNAMQLDAYYRATLNALDEGIMVLDGPSITWAPLVGTSRGAALLRIARFVDTHPPLRHAHGKAKGIDAVLRDVDARLTRAPRSGNRIALVRFRLQPLELPTDRLGHSPAQDLMTLLEGRIAETVRAGDVVLHVDDTTLAIVLEGVDSLSCAECVADTIRAAVSHPVRLVGQTFEPEFDVTVTLVDSVTAAADALAAGSLPVR